MIVPWQDINPDTLNHLLEEFASRDGTDYGAYETRLADKVVSLLKAMLYRARVRSAREGDHVIGGKEEIHVFLGTAPVVNRPTCAAEVAC